MEMKRYMIIVGLLAAISCALMVPAFAVGSDPIYDATASQTPLSATEMTPMQSLMMSAGESGVPTVNISEESVQAIADAVMSTGEVTSKAGITYTVPSAALEVWNEYDHHVAVAGSIPSLQYWYLFDNVLIPDTDGYVCFGAPGVRVYGSGVMDLNDLTDARYTTRPSSVLWSDTDLPDSTGVIYAADVEIERAYTISFKTGFPDLDATLSPVSSDAFALPEVSYPGYVFSGWYLDSNCVTPFPDGYEFKQDTILYAKWTKVPVVSFVSGFDDLTFEEQYANALTLPRPTHDGSVFVGWYLDEEYTQPFSLGMEITEDITLYAKWTESLPMSFFATSVFDSLTVISECQPIFYLVSIGALAIVLAIIKRFMDSRIY